MAIPPEATFRYTGVVPDRHLQASGAWQLREFGAESSAGRASVSQTRLVGPNPSLLITEADVPPGIRVSPHTGYSRPKVPTSRLTFRAGHRDSANIAEFSFCVDQALTRSWQAGDVLHVARTANAGLGLSIARGTRLVAAIGAVTAVPCHDVSISEPRDAINEAERVFRRLDPEFEFRERPIEIHVGSETRVLYRGRMRLGGYELFVEHGAHPGLPGVSECAALSLVGSCPETPAIFSAQLMEYQDLSTMVRW